MSVPFLLSKRQPPNSRLRTTCLVSALGRVGWSCTVLPNPSDPVGLSRMIRTPEARARRSITARTVVAGLIVVGHEETGSWRGMRPVRLVADAGRGGWIDATGEATVAGRVAPARRTSPRARILQKAATE
jgi:hypothetical protein